MTEIEALTKLARNCQASVYPMLDNSDLSAILDAFTDWVDWSAEEAVVEWDRRKVSGRVYTCTVAGTTGEEEPATSIYSRRTGIAILDGSVHWIDSGPAAVSPYNLRGATRAAFEVKMAKVAAEVDVSDADASLKRSQLLTNLERMANRYRTLSVA